MLESHLPFFPSESASGQNKVCSHWFFGQIGLQTLPSTMKPVPFVLVPVLSYLPSLTTQSVFRMQPWLLPCIVTYLSGQSVQRVGPVTAVESEHSLSAPSLVLHDL